jgi:hypothetical protein
MSCMMLHGVDPGGQAVMTQAAMRKSRQAISVHYHRQDFAIVKCSNRLVELRPDMLHTYVRVKCVMQALRCHCVHEERARGLHTASNS